MHRDMTAQTCDTVFVAWVDSNFPNFSWDDLDLKEYNQLPRRISLMTRIPPMTRIIPSMTIIFPYFLLYKHNQKSNWNEYISSYHGIYDECCDEKHGQLVCAGDE